MSDQLENDETVDVVAAIRRAAPEVPSHRSVELVASRAWRLSTSRRRVEWLHAPGVLGALLVAVLGVAAVGGISAVRPHGPTQVAEVPELATALKYRAGSDISLLPLREAAEQVDFVPMLLPEPSALGKLRGAVLTEMTPGGGRDADDLILGVIYDDAQLTQFQWPTPASAREALTTRMTDTEFDGWVHEATVSGEPAYAWSPGHRSDSATGAKRIAAYGHGVAWVHGRMLYTLSSDSVDDEVLLDIASSLDR